MSSQSFDEEVLKSRNNAGGGGENSADLKKVFQNAVRKNNIIHKIQVKKGLISSK